MVASNNFLKSWIFLTMKMYSSHQGHSAMGARGSAFVDVQAPTPQQQQPQQPTPHVAGSAQLAQQPGTRMNGTGSSSSSSYDCSARKKPRRSTYDFLINLIRLLF